MVDVDKAEEPTMVVRELSVPPPRGLAFRFAWVGAGRNSARDDEAVALMARKPGARL